ncbi:50S ribosomal protein L3 [Mycoplasmopsis cricetuli]|uniref:50S ribosomal protein L3 n=1 Tax=Mycoplasmopsis cricetuli TaxID=171283 RepID=UPI000472AD7D|nr:50S ribosomal protein L3 [Mycoplasmopsis cricetuli]
MKGILGRKVGMTQIYTDKGSSIPVTVVEVQPNVVSKVLTVEKNGYVATQLATFDKKASRVNKPDAGQFIKANTTPKRYIKEIRNMSGYEYGQVISADIFKSGELVDITGVSKGKGFAGAIKRHNQHIGPKSHGGGGGSQPVRQTGSLGDISGNRVYKGMTMPGHLGNVKTTIQNLEIIKIDATNNYLLVKGSIPGPKKSLVIIKEAIKGLPNKEATTLVNIKDVLLMNELVEKAKKYHVEVTVGMNVEELSKLIEEAEEKAKVKVGEK